MTKTLMFPSGIPSDRPSAPADRPSERPTRPTLPPPDDPSDESIDAAIDSAIEISERDFVDDDVAIDSGVKASTFRPPAHREDAPKPPRRSWLLPALRIAAAALLLLVAIVLLLEPSTPAITNTREPRAAWPDRTSIASPAAEPLPRPAAQSCIATAPPRFVAPRALVNPGLDVSSTDTGFVVALASASDEASAIRLEGTALRAAENVRLRLGAATPIRRAVARAVDHDDATSPSIELRADTDDARTVIPEGEGPTFRVSVAGRWVIARAHDQTHSLWSLPLPPKDRRIDALRVAPRDDGGAVVVIKRGSTLYLGLVNGAFASTGPLQTIARPHATIGTPYVVANGGAAAVAWAERANGARDWTIMVASMGGGEMETKPVAERGMSPSLGVFPDGTLAVAYADGPASAHRVVVRRLAADLTPIGEPVVASTENLNAGQPVIDIRSDGRALVAWFAVARGQPPSVYATPLACDVSPPAR